MARAAANLTGGEKQAAGQPPDRIPCIMAHFLKFSD